MSKPDEMALTTSEPRRITSPERHISITPLDSLAHLSSWMN